MVPFVFYLILLISPIFGRNVRDNNDSNGCCCSSPAIPTCPAFPACSPCQSAPCASSTSRVVCVAPTSCPAPLPLPSASPSCKSNDEDNYTSSGLCCNDCKEGCKGDCCDKCTDECCRSPAKKKKKNKKKKTSSCAQKARDELKAIEKSMICLQREVACYCHSILNVMPLLSIQSQSTNLAQQVADTAHQIQCCPKFSEEDSALVLGATLEMVPVINTTVNTLNCKKCQFNSAILGKFSVTKLVYKDTLTLKQNTDCLGKALYSRVPDYLQSAVELTVAQIDEWFDCTLCIYSS